MSGHIKKSSGNVFADLGVKNPEEALVKARLAHVISEAISARGMTQVDAAAFLGIDQPRVSRLVRGQLKITVVGGRQKSRRAGHMKIASN